MVAAMPPRYRLMVLLAAWCALRFGELAELRRGDVDLEARLVRVQRGVTRAGGEVFIGDPKGTRAAGRRSVSIPPHLMPLLEAHLDEHVGADPEALLFPARHGGNLAPSSLYKVWYPAREAAGRSDLHFHDLRHTGATLAAATGATLADLMSRLGHSTPAAALRYQHAAADRDRAVADALSGFAEAKVIPLRRASER
jgi:integrase